MKTQRLINSILLTLLSIYPLFTIFTISGEIHASKGLPAVIFAQLTFWLLVLLIISSYFLTKVNTYIVILISILNITLNLILTFEFLGITLTNLANPSQIYAYLLAIIGISILYIWSKLIHSTDHPVQTWLPTVFAILLGIIEFLLI